MITEREREIPDMGVGEILLSNSEGSIQRLFGLKIKGRKKEVLKHSWFGRDSNVLCNNKNWTRK